MAYIYLDREGTRINKDQWTEKQKDASYRILREFDNGTVFLRLMWNGRMTVQEMAGFRDYWPLFQMAAGNYTADGSLQPDPNLNGETYSSEEAGIQAYEKFLETWTDCERKDNGKFVEVDNQLAPPPPPDPDIPKELSKGDADSFGSW